LFETFLAIGDRVVFLDDHFDRLERGARLIDLSLPFPRATIIKWIHAANLKNRAEIKKIRVTVTAGDSAFWAGRASKSKIIIIVTDYCLPEKSFRLTVSPFRVDRHSPFRNVKTLSFIIEMTSRKKAYHISYDDSLLLNRSGYIAETSSANIFWVKNGVLSTTPLSSGCLDGMTRKHILLIAKDNNIPTRITNVTLKNLLKADEIFVTSSIKLIIPVSSVKTEKVHRFRTGAISRRLKNLLRQYIGITD
jgi:branched-subunit amino acid aminotransferase/4-amino-4-deoxychorismate lyase